MGSLLAAVLLVPDAAGNVQENVDQGAGVAPHVAGELLVSYEAGINTPAAERVPEAVEGEVEEEIPTLDTQVVEFPEVKGNPAENQRERILRQKKEALEENPAVESASYNYIYEAAYTPNDRGFGGQYGLRKIQAPLAWNKVRGRGIDIAVVDTGISNAHPDLRRKISGQANCTNEPAGVPGCAGGPGTAEDDNGHGTQVAGVAAAVTGNRLGIAGACPECRLLVAKSLDANNTGTADDIAQGIAWATQNGAEVTNLSLGSPDADSPVVEDAIDQARRKGVVVLAAAGNYGTGFGEVYPAAYDNVLAVAATNRSNQRATFSSTGAWLDVAAPGEGISSTSYPTGYGKYDGTSYSTAYVAGVAGLLAGQGRAAGGIQRRINSTAGDLGPRGKDRLYGRGLVNAAAAAGVRNTRPRILNPRPKPRSKTRDRTPKITAIVRDRETNLKKSGLTLILDNKKRINFKYNVARDRLSFTPKRKLAPGRHPVEIVARDGQGLKTTKKWSFVVRKPKAKPPKPRVKKPVSIIHQPNYPFNVLPDWPIYDKFKN